MSGSCRRTFESSQFIFSRSLFSPSNLGKAKRKKMAYGRRYKAKLHVLEDDDLASILTPAPPCKVPGLGTKGREKGEEMSREARFFFSCCAFFFFCGSHRLRNNSLPSARSCRAFLFNQTLAAIRAGSIRAHCRQGFEDYGLASWLTRRGVFSFSSFLAPIENDCSTKCFCSLSLSNQNTLTQSSPPWVRRAATSRRSRTCSRPGCRACALT